MKKYNIFLEGIPGSGKSTLLDKLSSNLNQYTAYREGDLSPIELAWCSYMTKEQYEEAITKFPELAEEIENHMVVECKNYIVAYTKIHAKQEEFYKYMEQFEIYAGRRSEEEFRDIIYERFAKFTHDGAIFECSFFQNTMDELLLYKVYSVDQVVGFYKGLIERINMENFKLIRLVTTDIEKSILAIKAERVNERGEEDWYCAMTEYLANSPYSKVHKLEGVTGLIDYFKLRLQIEEKIIEFLPKQCYLEVKSKEYELANVLKFMKEN